MLGGHDSACKWFSAMGPRFQVVSAPIEERVHSTLQEQTAIAVNTIATLLKFVSEKKNGALNSTISMMSDEDFVQRVASSSARLIKPTSLPGFLLVLAVATRVAYWAVLSYTCHKALARTSLNLKNGKVD